MAGWSEAAERDGTIALTGPAQASAPAAMTDRILTLTPIPPLARTEDIIGNALAEPRCDEPCKPQPAAPSRSNIGITQPSRAAPSTHSTMKGCARTAAQ